MIGPERHASAIALLVAVAVAPACADDGAATPGPSGAAVAGVEVPDGFAVTEVVTGLVGPTQIALLSDGRLVVAQLDGGEGDGTGQIVVVDPASDGSRPCCSTTSSTPTGVAVLGDEVWVMEQRRLSRGPLTGGELTTVLDDLPFNGRSEGSLTATDDGRILYDTSGTIDGVDAAAGLGRPVVDRAGWPAVAGRHGLQARVRQDVRRRRHAVGDRDVGRHLRRGTCAGRAGGRRAGRRLRLAAVHR